MQRLSKRRILLTFLLITLAAVVVAFLGYRERCALTKAKEDVLRQDLFTLRAAIDGYKADQRRFPAAISEPVSAGYLRRVLVDPMTGRNDTWIVQWSAGPRSPGIVDIRSGSKSIGRDGTPYATW